MVPQRLPVQPVPLRLHVTAVFVDPVTVAVNCCCPPTPTEMDAGDTPTETLAPEIVTVVDPMIDGFDSETAVTVTVLGLGVDDGAV